MNMTDAPTEFPESDGIKMARARAAFDAIHATDPRRLPPPGGGAPEAHSMVYHRRLGHWVDRVSAQNDRSSTGSAPSDALQVAAMAQHIERWKHPRSDAPAGRAGYKKWRSGLLQTHAQVAARVGESVGIDAATIERAQELILKRRLGRDAEVQTFEDAICLTFLETELEAFAANTAHPEKLPAILQKTWAKMSPAGHALAADALSGVPEALRTQVLDAVAEAPISQV